MDKIVLQAEPRNVIGKKVKILRQDGKLPAVIYGKSTEPISISLDLKIAEKVLNTISSSTLLTIEVDGKEFTTLVRESQRDFIRRNYLHVDFLAVSLTEKVTAFIDLVLKGVAPALENFECLLITGIDQVEVESLPQDLPENLEIDISSLEAIGEGIYVKDLKLPNNIDVLTNLDDMIVVVAAQVIAEEEEELDEEALLEGELVDGEAVEGEAEEIEKDDSGEE